MLHRQAVVVGAFLFAGAAVLSCAADPAPPREADVGLAPLASSQQPTSGIRGKVLRGPLVGGPLVGEEPSEGPFSATFHVHDTDGNEVASFQSDAEGLFDLLLAPGDYLIVADETAPVFRPQEQKQAVTIPAGEIIELTLRFDTGMR